MSLNLDPGLWAVSAQYRTPCGGLGHWRGYFRHQIDNHEIIKRIQANPHRKFAGDLRIYDIKRIAA